MKYTWWQKMKPWIMQGTITLVSLVLVWLEFGVLHGMIRNEMDEIQKLDVLREYRGRQLQQLPELERQHSLINERGKKLDIIVTKDELVQFIQTLEELANETGVKITIASKDNTLLESKITLVTPPTKGSKGAADQNTVQEDAAPAPQPKRSAKQSEGLLDEIVLKKYIRLTLTVTAPYESMIAYLHKIETLPYATDIIGVTVKESREQQEKMARETETTSNVGETVVSEPAHVLDTDFDMLVYTKE